MDLTKDILDKMRDVEGFPIGKDEDIVKLSNPPFYTACPNPFTNEFIKKNGKPYNEENDDYNVEPYTADISEGKNDPIYNAHTYHTKVPHKAVMKYILHYTQPGDIIFDGFCGTGMTGVAAQACGNPDKSLKIELESEISEVKFGVRKAVLNDISPAATFIAANYNLPIDIKILEKDALAVLEECKRECGWVYATIHTDKNGNIVSGIDGKPIYGKINYVIWSDVFICPNCSKELVFWDVAMDTEKDQVSEKFVCSSCGVELKKTDCERSRETYYDKILDKTLVRNLQVPVRINYSVGKKRFQKKLTAEDYSTLEQIFSLIDPEAISTFPMMNKGGTHWGEIWRAGYHFGVTHSHHFYTDRNLFVLWKIWSKANSSTLRWAITGILNYVNKKQSYTGGGGGMPGVLYIASLVQEKNVFDVLERKLKSIIKAFEKEFRQKGCTLVTTQSSCRLESIENNTIDYIFVDPPFGSNIMYSEGSFLWEAWLKIFTNNKQEAIESKYQGKDLNDYKKLMFNSFSEFYRILKPGRWMTVEFHNSQNSIWNAIHEAILNAGFVVANVKTLDKKQGSFKQVTTTSAVKQDLIISAYKPKASFVQRFLTEAGTEEGVWDFTREHLSKLPVIVENRGKLDIIPERQNYLLYDSMVAFHIQKGASIPLGAADLYLGLKQRFPERDGMYFLPGQVSVYDSKRMIQELNEQLSLIVLDEKTAIQWLHKELEVPQTYQEIQPKFLQELKQLKYEKMPELRNLLEENFLQDEHAKWYVPDVNKQSDLEKLRDKKLLKEFDEYREGKGKLKVFRTEAIRAGFKYCWKERDYKTIVNIGERLPESVVQEDPSILMYFDNAQTRIGD